MRRAAGAGPAATRRKGLVARRRDFFILDRNLTRRLHSNAVLPAGQFDIPDAQRTADPPAGRRIDNAPPPTVTGSNTAGPPPANPASAAPQAGTSPTATQQAGSSVSTASAAASGTCLVPHAATPVQVCTDTESKWLSVYFAGNGSIATGPPSPGSPICRATVRSAICLLKSGCTGAPTRAPPKRWSLHT